MIVTNEDHNLLIVNLRTWTSKLITFNDSDESSISCVRSAEQISAIVNMETGMRKKKENTLSARHD